MYKVRHLSGPRPKRGTHFETGLVIPVYNRPEYVRRCWESLCKSDLQNTLVLMMDDASNNPDVIDMLENFSIPGQSVFWVRRELRTGFGVSANLRFSFDFLCAHFDCRHLAILDSDTVVRPHWLMRLRDVHAQLSSKYPRFFLTGFNTPKHKTLKSFRDYRVKHSFGGVSLFFERGLYASLLRPCLTSRDEWDWEMSIACREQGVFLLCVRPSVVQHIGRDGAWSHGILQHDWSLDYLCPIPAWLETVVGAYLRNAWGITGFGKRTLRKMRIILNGRRRSIADTGK